MDKKLTVTEAAERAGVSVSLIYQLCDERRLAHYRLGAVGKRGKIMIEAADLDALLAALKVDVGSARPTPHRKFRHLT